jgi:hypothetical protein
LLLSSAQGVVQLVQNELDNTDRSESAKPPMVRNDLELKFPTRGSTNQSAVVGGNGKHFALSLDAGRLVAALMLRPQSFAELRRALADDSGAVPSIGSIHDAIDSLPPHLFGDDAAPTLHPFSIRYEVLPGRIVARVAAWLAPLMAPMAMVAVLIGLTLACPFLAHAGLRLGLLSNGADKIWLPFIVAFSMVAHELGHAIACHRCGATPRGIGVGLYLIFPALYTDVSPAWMLSRWQRVLVDAGGFYMQGIVVLLLTPFALGGSHAALLGIWSNVLLVVFNLNPMLKLDGYWIVSDATGIANLHLRARQYLRLRRSPELTRSQEVLVIAYAIFLVCYLAVFVGGFGRWLFLSAMHMAALFEQQQRLGTMWTLARARDLVTHEWTTPLPFAFLLLSLRKYLTRKKVTTT